MPVVILDNVKKSLGILPSVTIYDDVIVMHINSVFSALNQLGVGPIDGFMIGDDLTVTWDDFIADDNRYNLVRTYICVKVRFLFDPPTVRYAIEATEKIIQEYEWRMNITREGDSWTPPTT